MYLPGPSGLANNDDLGANSSTFIWEMLGMYPENSGSNELVFASPGFPHVAIPCPTARRSPATRPAPRRPVLRRLAEAQRQAKYSKLYVPFSTLARGATLDWTLGTTPTSWGSAPQDAPPSYGPVFADTASISPSSLDIQPGATATATLSVSSLTGSSQIGELDGQPVLRRHGEPGQRHAVGRRQRHGHGTHHRSPAARPTGPTRSRST